MLDNNGTEVLTDVQKELAKLEVCHLTFHQTGSRFFGGYTDKSDYDFFVRNALFIYDTLQDMGYSRLLRGLTYCDRQTCDVYRKTVGNTHIDIQIVEDEAVKFRAQEILKLHAAPFVTGKSEFSPIDRRRGLWEMAYKMAELEMANQAYEAELNALGEGYRKAMQIQVQ